MWIVIKYITLGGRRADVNTMQVWDTNGPVAASGRFMNNNPKAVVLYAEVI